MKSLLFASAAAAVLGWALLACQHAPPVVQPPTALPPAAPVPTVSVSKPSPSLRPPVLLGLSTAVPALPEPPSHQPQWLVSVTLEGVSAAPGRAAGAGAYPPAAGGPAPRLFEPAAPAPTPSAAAQYALIERVAAGGARKLTAPPQASQVEARKVETARAAPSSAPTKTPAPKPRETPAAAATAAARPAAGSTDSAAVLPSVARPAAAPVAPAASSAGPAEAGLSREVLARAGDPIEIAFDGRGWLYLGITAAQPGRGAGVSFQGGGSSGGRSVFSFRAVEHGQYTLRFQLQDNLAGRVVEESVRLSVLPDAEFAARLASHSVPQSPGAPADPRPDPDRVAAAERWFSLGEYDRAVAAFLEGHREGDAYLNDRVAASYWASGDHLAAAKYYRRNLAAAEPFASQAVAGLVRAALATGDTALLLEQFPALLRAREAQVGGELLEVGRAQLVEERFAIAQEALQEYLRRYPDGRELDEACFLLAQLLEAESPFRDLRRARDLYHRVYEEFPESRFATPAQVRRDYLTRHFFQVR